MERECSYSSKLVDEADMDISHQGFSDKVGLLITREDFISEERVAPATLAFPPATRHYRQ
jgi:hypothetical protein